MPQLIIESNSTFSEDPTIIQNVFNEIDIHDIVTNSNIRIIHTSQSSSSSSVINRISTTSGWYYIDNSTSNFNAPVMSTCIETFYTTTTNCTTTTNESHTRPFYFTSYNSALYINNKTKNIENPRVVRKKQQGVRQSIKRAVKLLECFGLGDDVRMFMKGESIEISHPDSNLKFVITKNRDLIHSSQYNSYSSPFKTELYTKDNIFISDLCLFSKDTPVLDHLLNLSLHVQTGDEDEILKKANYYNRTKEITSDILLLADDRPYMHNKLRI